MVKAERIAPLLRSWPLLSVVVFNLFIFGLFLFKRDLGANVIFFEVASLVPILLLNKNKSFLFYIKMLLAIALATCTWIRADFLTVNLSFVAVVFLNVVLFQEAVTGKLVSISFFLNLPFLFFDKISIYTGQAVRFLSRFQVYVHKSKIDTVKTDIFKKVLLGLIISFPILIVLVILFATADQNFQAVFSNFFTGLQNIFDFHWLYNLNFIFDRIWLFGLFWIYLCFTLPVSESLNTENVLPQKRVVEKMTVVTLVSAVFALFIATQAKSINYILNGFTTGQLNPGAFVREGFIQLMIACIVGMTVFSAVKKELGKRVLTVLLLTEVFLVSIVAIERVWLYQDQFGLTQARVWGLLFLFFVLIVIGALFLELFKKITDKGLAQIVLLGFSCTIFIAGLLNVDYAIALYRPPVMNGEVDTTYMANNLSYDSVSYWVQGLQNIQFKNTSDCKSQDNLSACRKTLQKFKTQYMLAKNINLFLNTLEGYYSFSQDSSDISAFCKKNNDWFTQNLSVLQNTKEICAHYPQWKEFKNKYEELSNDVNPPQSAQSMNVNTPVYVSVPPSPLPFYSCRTLGGQMVTDRNGLGQIGCDIQVIGQIDMSKSYCEGQMTHRKEFLIPDAYQRANKYYATLGGLNVNEEVNVFITTQAGKKVECLPSLNAR